MQISIKVESLFENFSSLNIKQKPQAIVAEVENLLANGGDINQKISSSGISFLHLAISCDSDKRYIDKLITLGVDANIQDNEGKPPIFYLTSDAKIQADHSIFSI